MKNQPTHTPTPSGVLTLSENGQDVYVPGIEGGDGTGIWLSRFDIVRAVNAYQPMLDALRIAEKQMAMGQRGMNCPLCYEAGDSSPWGDKHDSRCALVIARTAIARAEGK